MKIDRKIVLLIPLVGIIIGVFLGLVDHRVCMTGKCREVASMMKARIKSDVDPCDDFYQFACGNLLLQNNIMSIYGMLNFQNAIQFRKVTRFLLEPPLSDEPTCFKLTKQLLKQCFEGSSPKITQVLELLKEEGGFPLIEGGSWKEDNWSWMEVTNLMRKKGFNNWALFSYSLNLSPLNNSRWALEIGPPPLPDFQFLQLFVISVDALLFGQDRFIRELREMSELYKTIVNNIVNGCDHLPPADGLYGLRNHTKTLVNISSSYDFINWRDFIGIILQSKKHISDDLVIIDTCPEFMKRLHDIFNSTSKRLLANYVMWNSLRDLKNILTGERERKSSCFFIISDLLPDILETMYAVKYGDKSYMNDLTDMLLKIKTEIIKSVENSDWMDSSTKHEAIIKIEHMKSKIGYPDFLKNSTYINTTFLVPQLGESFLDSYLIIKKFNTDKQFKQIDETIDKGSWEFYLSIIQVYEANAAYVGVANSVYILEGLLKFPLFELSWPKFLHYGGLGAIVGHEVTHSLDISGSHYDMVGAVRNWWQPKTYANFIRKATCFIEQFNNFTVFDGTRWISLPGDLEVNENVADSGGVRLAFQAYRETVANQFWPDLQLPGLPYNCEQLFFISFAHWHCAKFIPEALDLSDVHAPPFARVIGSLRNTEYFSEVFGCPAGSSMNPKHECHLW